MFENISFPDEPMGVLEKISNKKEKLLRNIEENVDNARLEKVLVTGRNLTEYQRGLGFDQELLRGKKVLNFGCGMSTIDKDLKKEKIDCDLVEIDIDPDPMLPQMNNSLRFWGAMPFRILSKIDKFDNLTKHKILNLKRKIEGTNERNFVQGDGRMLPFPDGLLIMYYLRRQHIKFR